MTIEVAACSHEAAAYAMTNWHYADNQPIGKLVKYGAWEDGEFVGAVIYGRGATPTLGQRFGCSQEETCELVRVALRERATPTSQIVAETLRLIAVEQPGLRVAVSFADTKQRHLGIIYQAMNWTYLGTAGGDPEFWLEGRWVHNRELAIPGFGTNPQEKGRYQHAKELRQTLPRRLTQIKHRYAYPLDAGIRRLLRRMAQPYPKEI